MQRNFFTGFKWQVLHICEAPGTQEAKSVTLKDKNSALVQKLHAWTAASFSYFGPIEENKCEM